jgi:hypothetical protein
MGIVFTQKRCARPQHTARLYLLASSSQDMHITRNGQVNLHSCPLAVHHSNLASTHCSMLDCLISQQCQHASTTLVCCAHHSAAFIDEHTGHPATRTPLSPSRIQHANSLNCNKPSMHHTLHNSLQSAGSHTSLTTTAHDVITSLHVQQVSRSTALETHSPCTSACTQYTTTHQAPLRCNAWHHT